jgi:hypothetical protein
MEESERERRREGMLKRREESQADILALTRAQEVRRRETIMRGKAGGLPLPHFERGTETIFEGSQSARGISGERKEKNREVVASTSIDNFNEEKSEEKEKEMVFLSPSQRKKQIETLLENSKVEEERKSERVNEEGSICELDPSQNLPSPFLAVLPKVERIDEKERFAGSTLSLFLIS